MNWRKNLFDCLKDFQSLYWSIDGNFDNKEFENSYYFDDVKVDDVDGTFADLQNEFSDLLDLPLSIRLEKWEKEINF